jgi:hypothetical protein
MIPLRAYFSGIVTRKMFTDTVSRLIDIIKDCEKNQLDARNLALSPDHIFVEPSTKAVKCILWPLKNNRNARSPAAFFQDLPYTLVFSKNEDCAYVADYIRLARALQEPFAVSDLERLCGGEEPGPPPASAGGTAGTAPEPRYDPLKSMVGRNAAPGRRNVCPSCGIVNAMGAKICVSCGAALMEQADANMKTHTGTAVLGYTSGVTGSTDEESPYPYLIRESTNQIISVDKPEFRIGKDKKNADFCVPDNTAISRSHVIIHTRNDRYFIVDQNSTNKTYIDERALAPHQEVEIFPGAKIKLANEQFIFYI